jgi:hypothetical protein
MIKIELQALLNKLTEDTSRKHFKNGRSIENGAHAHKGTTSGVTVTITSGVMVTIRPKVSFLLGGNTSTGYCGCKQYYIILRSLNFFSSLHFIF